MKARLATKIKGKDQIFDFECVTLIEKNTYSSPFLLMEMAGPITAVRAAWAHLVKRREGNDTVATDIKVQLNTGGVFLRVTPGNKIYSAPQNGNLVLYTQGFGPRERKYFLGGDMETPSDYFLDAFRINVSTLPILREWANELWKRGLNKGLLMPLKTYGHFYNAWEIAEAGWIEIVKEVAKEWHKSQQSSKGSTTRQTKG